MLTYLFGRLLFACLQVCLCLGAQQGQECSISGLLDLAPISPNQLLSNLPKQLHCRERIPAGYTQQQVPKLDSGPLLRLRVPTWLSCRSASRAPVVAFYQHSLGTHGVVFGILWCGLYNATVLPKKASVCSGCRHKLRNTVVERAHSAPLPWGNHCSAAPYYGVNIAVLYNAATLSDSLLLAGHSDSYRCSCSCAFTLLMWHSTVASIC